MSGDFDNAQRLPGDRAGAVSWILQRLDEAQPPVDPTVGAVTDESHVDERKRRSSPGRPTAAPAPPAPALSSSQPNRRSSHAGGGSRRQPPNGSANADDAGTHRRCADFATTDLGNAERFAVRFKTKILWCPALGWLVWDGRRYAIDAAEELVKEAEHQTVRFIQDEARVIEQEARSLGPDAAPGDDSDAALGPDDVKERKERLLKHAKALRIWGRKSEANKGLSVIARNAKPYLRVDVRSLNADPMKLNVLNGTLAFDREIAGYIELRPHNPADLITRLAPVEYQPDAACPAYDTFTARVQPDAEMRAFLHRWAGYSLTADAGEQKFVIFYGTGRNGKGTFVELCAHIAGDYAEYVPIETFVQGSWQTSGAQARPDLMLLHNARMVRSVEPNEGMRLDEALIKQITGGDPVTARDLNRPMVRFRPYLKLTISANYRPGVRGNDKGIWDRIKLVPWETYIPDEERDRDLPKKLQAEASGVLNRLLDGLRQWFDVGLAFPEAVERATAEYREDSDVVGQFLEECTRAEESARVQSSNLHRVFVAWQKARGERGWSNKAMSNALLARGLRKKKSNGEWWLGLTLTRTEDDFIGFDGRPRPSPAEPGERPVGDEIAF